MQCDVHSYEGQLPEAAGCCPVERTQKRFMKADELQPGRLF